MVASSKCGENKISQEIKNSSAQAIYIVYFYLKGKFKPLDTDTRISSIWSICPWRNLLKVLIYVSSFFLTVVAKMYLQFNMVDKW